MDKRDEIIRAAIELIAEHGFHGAPMAKVAAEAGVAAGTIYRYFESKDDLIRATHAHVEAQLLAVLRAGYPAAASARERFLHIGTALVGYFIGAPREFRFLSQFYDSPYGVDHRREKLLGAGEQNLVLGLLREALAEGLVKQLPLPILLALTFGPLVDICRDHTLDFIALDDRLIAQVVAACWDGISC